MFRLLLVEDVFEIKEIVNSYFLKKRSGEYNLDIANDFYDGINKLRSNDYDLVILDSRIAAARSRDECVKYRKYSRCRIVQILDLNDSDEVDCADVICPDGIVVRATVEEDLILTVRNLLKEEARLSKDVLEFGGIRVDLLTDRITIDGKQTEFTSTESKLLRILMANRGKILEREFLLKKVWGDGYGGNSRVVDNKIRYLRQRLGNKEDLIRTVKGKGYIFGE